MAGEPHVDLIFGSRQAARNLSTGLAEVYPGLCPPPHPSAAIDPMFEASETVIRTIPQLPQGYLRAFLKQVSAATQPGSLVITDERNRERDPAVRKVFYLGGGNVTVEAANMNLDRTPMQMGEL